MARERKTVDSQVPLRESECGAVIALPRQQCNNAQERDHAVGQCKGRCPLQPYRYIMIMYKQFNRWSGNRSFRPPSQAVIWGTKRYLSYQRMEHEMMSS